MKLLHYYKFEEINEEDTLKIRKIINCLKEKVHKYAIIMTNIEISVWNDIIIQLEYFINGDLISDYKIHDIITALDFCAKFGYIDRDTYIFLQSIIMEGYNK